MTDEELTAKWLKTNKPKQFSEPEPVYYPYSGNLIPTNNLTKVQIDPYTKKRIYTFLGKTTLLGSLDETTRNYGN